MFTDEWNLKVIGLDEEEKVVWAQALRKWFPPVASSNICRCCCLIDKSSRSLCNPVDCSPPAPLSMGFPRQEHWSGLPFPSPGDHPNAGIQPRSPALQVDSLLSEPPGKPRSMRRLHKIHEIVCKTPYTCCAFSRDSREFMQISKQCAFPK